MTTLTENMTPIIAYVEGLVTTLSVLLDLGRACDHICLPYYMVENVRDEAVEALVALLAHDPGR